MIFAMAAPIDLRNDFDSVSLRRCEDFHRDARSRRLLASAEVYWFQQDLRRDGVGLQEATGCCVSTPADRTGWSMGSRRTLANADHRPTGWMVVHRPGPGGRWPVLAAQGPGAVALGTFAISLDETTVGRELRRSVPGSRRGRATTAKRAGRRLLPNFVPAGEDPGEGSRKASR